MALEKIKEEWGLVPERIQTDNGSGLISKEMDRWAYDNNVTMDDSRPGKPTENPFVESFNGRFRNECLNAHWFLSLEDAVMKIEAWRTAYNPYGLNSSLMDMTPVEFINYCLKAKDDEQSLPGGIFIRPDDFFDTWNTIIYGRKIICSDEEKTT